MLILPSRFSNGPNRPQGPFSLNRGSLQAQGLALWWPATMDCAARVADKSGRGNDSTAGAWSLIQTEFGPAIRLNGTSDYIRLLDGARGLGNVCSVSVWMRSNAIDGQRGIWEISNGTTAERLVRYWFNPGGQCLYDQDGSNYYIGIRSFPTTWTHEVSVLNGGGAKSSVYWNGEVWTGLSVDNNQTTQNGLDSFMLGAYGAGTPSAFLSADLLDICIHDHALTPAEIWHQYDPATRWDLYWQPSGKTLFWPENLGGAPASGNIKTLMGVAWANVKTINGVAVANIKAINGVAAQ